MANRAPKVGDIVHYVSHGTPIRPDGTQVFESECRAAMITEVYPMLTGQDELVCSLTVFNPSGLFFNECFHHEDEKRPGTWHWPDHD